MKKPIYSALVFFGTLLVLSAGYAGFVTLQSSDADSGKSLTSSMMQAVIENLSDLDGRVSTMSGAISSLKTNTGNLWGTVTGGIWYSGGNVGIGTSTPDSSAILDIASTTKGMAVPRMSKAQRNAIVSPVDGMILYCTDCSPKWFRYRINEKWLSKPTEDTVLTSTNPANAIYSGDGDCTDNETKTYMTPVTLAPWKWRVETNGTGYKYSGVATAIDLRGAPIAASFGIPFNPGWYFWLYKSEDVVIASATTFTPYLLPLTGCYQASLDRIYSFSIKFTLLDE